MGKQGRAGLAPASQVAMVTRADHPPPCWEGQGREGLGPRASPRTILPRGPEQTPRTSSLGARLSVESGI